MEGRPATITRSPGRRPPVILSKSVKPVGRPRKRVGVGVGLVDLVDDARQQRSDRSARPAVPREPPSAISNTFCSASSTSSRAVSPSLLKTAEAISVPAVISCRRSERSRTISA